MQLRWRISHWVREFKQAFYHRHINLVVMHLELKWLCIISIVYYMGILLSHDIILIFPEAKGVEVLAHMWARNACIRIWKIGGKIVFYRIILIYKFIQEWMIFSHVALWNCIYYSNLASAPWIWISYSTPCHESWLWLKNI